MTLMNIDLQALINEMGAIGAQERKRYHLTLGELGKQLALLPSAMLDAPVVLSGYACPPFEEMVENTAGRPKELTWSIENPHSYRGYYEDLAFEPTPVAVSTVADVLTMVTSALGATFEGYKGGDFTMSDDTPLWVSCYGSAERYAIMGMAAGVGKVTLFLKRIEL